MWTAWWLWMAGALVLAILEVLAPGFLFLGFAIGAAAIGAILFTGGPAAAFLTGSLPWTLVIFAVLSVIAWVVLRRVVGVRKGQVKVIDRDVNDD